MLKGYVYSVEMLIAISIILVALLFSFQDAPKEQDIEVSLLKRSAWEALEYLDSNRNLRVFVLNSNETVIEDNLKAIMAENINFETDICSLQCNSTNVPTNRTVVSIDYYISGYDSQFLSKKIKMWVWI